MVTGFVQCISIFTAYSKYNSIFNHLQITLSNQNVIELILPCCKSDTCLSIRDVVAINHIIHLIAFGFQIAQWHYICASVWVYSNACLNLLHHTAVSLNIDIKISRPYNWFAFWTCNPFFWCLWCQTYISLFQCVQITPINCCQLF